MEIIKCDKCKKVKRLGKGKSFSEGGWTSGNIRGGDPKNWISFDLCENCSKKLIKFIKSYFPKKYE